MNTTPLHPRHLKTRLPFYLALILLLASWCSGSRAAAAAARPNIVIILTDDMGWSDIGCYGGEIRTPHLDQLAAKGLRFTQFYNTARCCPTRAALLTGLYSHQSGMGHMVGDAGYPAYQGFLNDRCQTIAEVLRPAGYRTYLSGKWHVGENRPHWPVDRGFDRSYTLISGASSYFQLSPNRKMAIDDQPYVPPTNGFYITDAFTENAVRFVNEHVRDHRNAPFFLYLAYTAAHWPIHAYQEDIDAYNGVYDAGYDAIRRARLERLQALGLVDPKWTPSPTEGEWDKHPSPRWEARMMQAYAAMVSRMDSGVGRLVATLNKHGQLDNTLLFYLQDNGGCAEEMGHNKPAALQQRPGGPETFLGYGRPWANVSNTPFRYYKHWEHEGGIATPLIVHWPAGIPASRHNQLVREPGHLVDLMATCREVAGAPYPTEVGGKRIVPPEGVSLVPAFAGEPLRRREPLFWEHEGNRAIRDGKWKLVSAFRRGGGAWELYDLDADRAEMHDLATQMPGKVKELSAQWDRWAERVGVQPWPLKKPRASAGGIR